MKLHTQEALHQVVSQQLARKRKAIDRVPVLCYVPSMMLAWPFAISTNVVIFLISAKSARSPSPPTCRERAHLQDLAGCAWLVSIVLVGVILLFILYLYKLIHNRGIPAFS